MPTHYEVLGVDPRASDEAIRAKFHSVAKQAHPDTAPMCELREETEQRESFWEKFQAAYNAIKSPAARSAYDAKLLALAPKCKVCKGSGESQQRTGWEVKTTKCSACNGAGKTL